MVTAAHRIGAIVDARRPRALTSPELRLSTAIVEQHSEGRPGLMGVSSLMLCV